MSGYTLGTEWIRQASLFLFFMLAESRNVSIFSENVKDGWKSEVSEKESVQNLMERKQMANTWAACN